MEDQAGFDLSEALAQWRLTLPAASADIAGASAGMEVRLLQTMRGLEASGLSPEEAFLLARSRVDGILAGEEQSASFEPRAVWPQRLLWMAAALLAYRFVHLFLGTAQALLGVAFGARPQTWWGIVSVTGFRTSADLMIFVALVFLCRRQRVASRVESWLSRSSIRRKPVVWCGGIAVIAQGMACMAQWCFTRAPVYQGEAAKAIARLSRQMGWLNLALAFVWPLLVLGLVAYLIRARRKTTGRTAVGDAEERMLRSASSADNPPQLAFFTQNWRRRLAAERGVTEEQAKEVAGHLHDSAESLCQNGFPAVEALWLAQRRLGGVSLVAAQLRKENPLPLWREKALWSCAGWTLMWVLQFLALPLVWLARPMSQQGMSAWWTQAWLHLPLMLQSLALWALLGFALGGCRKPAWTPRLKDRVVRGAALAFIGVMILLSLPKMGLGSKLDASEYARNPGKNALLFGLNEAFSQQGAAFPAPQAGLPGLLVWLFLGSRMQMVVLSVTVCVLLRRSTVQGDFEEGGPMPGGHSG